MGVPGRGVGRPEGAREGGTLDGALEVPGLRVGVREEPGAGVGFLVGCREGADDTVGRRVCPASRVG